MKRNSIASNWLLDHRLLLSIASLLGVGFFLAVSAATYRIGFPLDDAWIHLTYARNFALHGEWAFRLGEGSAGSTSPLWTALLSIGYLIRLSPYFWTFFLGWIILALMAIRAENVARRILSSYQSRIPWVGLFIALAWHLTWTAVSGMETLLHGLLVLIVLGMLMENSHQYLTLGLLAGLSVWVRPDGLTLLGPVLFTLLIRADSVKARAKALIEVCIGFGILFVFYLLFNLSLSGSPMPSTFYAKQAEYGAFWNSKSLIDRLTEYILPMVASPFVILLPGFLIWGYKSIRERSWGTLVGLIWVVGYIGIYFMRLPAYQHGRYIIPAFPILYLWGMLGFLSFVLSPKANRLAVLSWQILLIVLIVAFQLAGAVQNAQDVIFIETQMVRTAQWVNENLPRDAVLAVHDIGAIGYFTQNPLIDLAGLITPDVIPFIRDETQITNHLTSVNAGYLVTFQDWYPQMVEGRVPVFVAGLEKFPFDDNMSVYQWK